MIWYDIFHDMISSDLNLIYQSFSHFVPSPFSGAWKKSTCQDTKLWGRIPSFGLIPQGADVVGLGLGSCLPTKHRTNSSTSIGTGMDALKTLDKQLLGHKNEGKKWFGHTNSYGKNGMIWTCWFFGVQQPFGWRVHSLMAYPQLIVGFWRIKSSQRRSPVSMSARFIPVYHCMFVFKVYNMFIFDIL